MTICSNTSEVIQVVCTQHLYEYMYILYQTICQKTS